MVHLGGAVFQINKGYLSDCPATTRVADTVFSREYGTVLNDVLRTRLSSRRTIWLPPPPPSPVSNLGRRPTGRLRKERQLADGGGGEGVKSCDCEKVWSFINHSIQ
jgi:hypothetical protein